MEIPGQFYKAGSSNYQNHKFYRKKKKYEADEMALMTNTHPKNTHPIRPRNYPYP